MSPSDVRVNVIGWQGCGLGLAIQASKIYFAAYALSLNVNAIPLEPLLISDSRLRYLHPKTFKYYLSIYCYESVDLIMINTDYTYSIKRLIPTAIWNGFSHLSSVYRNEFKWCMCHNTFLNSLEKFNVSTIVCRN